MSRYVVVLSVICCLLFATGAFADVTVVPSYSAATDTWNYQVIMGAAAELQTFQIYLDPNMEYSYLTGIDNDAVGDNDWTNPGSLSSGTTGWPNLMYLEWVRPGGNTATTIDFYFSDKVDDMDLVNHPGALLLTDPGNEYAYSTGWQHGMTSVWTYTSLGDGYVVHNAITPEPGIIALLGLGVLGLAARLRRRVT